MTRKRVWLCSLATALFVFGVSLGADFILSCTPSSHWETLTADALRRTLRDGCRLNVFSLMILLIGFVLPSLRICVFLLLTEKTRIKPWLQHKIIKSHQEGEKVELLIGAVWLCTISMAF
jgi:hypothetical protein